MKLLGYNITKQLPRLPVVKKTIINTINPHSYCVAKTDDDFKYALEYSDFLLPDGIGIVWAAKVLRAEKIKKIAGYDAFLHLMEFLEKNSASCFFLGASETTLRLIEEKIKLEYPSVKVDGYSPPFKEKFSAEDSHNMCLKVNEKKPYVLFVGMTAPKTCQKKFDFYTQIHCRCFIPKIFKK